MQMPNFCIVRAVGFQALTKRYEIHRSSGGTITKTFTSSLTQDTRFQLQQFPMNYCVVEASVKAV